MFIVWGWRTRLSVKESGTFFSPATRMDGPYDLVVARRWFTLFWIPLIPLSVVGTYVRCGVTKRLFDPQVLSNPTNEEFTAQLAGGLREVLAAVLMADEVAGAEERRVAVELGSRQIPGYNDETLVADLQRVGQSPLDERLRYLSEALTTLGKEQLLSTAAAIMAAEQVIDPRTDQRVRSIGEALGMSPPHVHGVITTAIEARQQSEK